MMRVEEYRMWAAMCLRISQQVTDPERRAQLVENGTAMVRSCRPSGKIARKKTLSSSDMRRSGFGSERSLISNFLIASLRQCLPLVAGLGTRLGGRSRFALPVEGQFLKTGSRRELRPASAADPPRRGYPVDSAKRERPIGQKVLSSWPAASGVRAKMNSGRMPRPVPAVRAGIIASPLFTRKGP